jgi:hypothetical protein
VGIVEGFGYYLLYGLEFSTLVVLLLRFFRFCQALAGRRGWILGSKVFSWKVGVIHVQRGYIHGMSRGLHSGLP